MRSLVTLLLLTLLSSGAHALEGSFSVGYGTGEVKNREDTQGLFVDLMFNVRGGLQVGVKHEGRSSTNLGKDDDTQTYGCVSYQLMSGTTGTVCANDERYQYSFLHRGNTIYGMGHTLDSLYYKLGMLHGNDWGEGKSRTKATIGMGWIITPNVSVEATYVVGNKGSNSVTDKYLANLVYSF